MNRPPQMVRSGQFKTFKSSILGSSCLAASRKKAAKHASPCTLFGLEIALQ